MKKTIFAFIAILTATTASTAEAGSSPKALERFMEAQAKKHARSAPELQTFEGSGCADFSGTWAGTCEADGEKQDVKLSITQNACKSLQLEKDEVRLGENSVSVSSSLEPGVFASSVTNAKFLGNGQALHVNATFNIDAQALPLPVGGRFAGIATRAGEDLNFGGLLQVYMGVKDLVNSPVDCTLKKQ